jgi:hypothetical protein
MPAMTDAPRQTFPVYVFTRRHAIETPDRILAGTLRLNIFGSGVFHIASAWSWRKSSTA